MGDSNRADDPVLRAAADASPDDERDYVCTACGAWFLVGPQDGTECPDCGGAGRPATSQEQEDARRRELESGSVSDEELRRVLGL